MISTVKTTWCLNENNRHTFKKNMKKCKYIWLIKHFYYHILSLCFVRLCMGFCACCAENQICLNACMLKAASNNHSALLWFSLWASKRDLQLGCCKLTFSEKRLRSSSVFLVMEFQYSYQCNAEGIVQSYAQATCQPCFGICLYRLMM